MSTCHHSCRCDEHQRVVLLSGERLETTVHNIHASSEKYQILFGFILNDKGHRPAVRRKLDADVWEQYSGSGLDE